MQRLIYRFAFAFITVISLSLCLDNMKAFAQNNTSVDTTKPMSDHLMLALAAPAINLEYRSLKNKIPRSDNKEPESLTMVEIFGPQYALSSNLPKRDQWWVNFEASIIRIITMDYLRKHIIHHWNIGDGWRFATERSINYDLKTKSNTVWSVPVGVGMAKTFKIGATPFKLAFELQGRIEDQEKFEPVWLMELRI